MVLRLALLILLACSSVVWADENPVGCLACHVTHHQEYGTCTDCHRGDPRSSRHNIAHFGLIQGRHAWFNLPDTPLVEEGRRLLERYSCRRCHVSGNRGNQLATNLDVSTGISDPAALAEAIRNPVLFMPDFQLPDTLLDRILNGLYALGRQAEPIATEIPQIVHFNDRIDAQDNVFVKHCGGCHQALTAKHGGLGTGIVAPNLSGLFTEHYPKTAGEDKSWTRDTLKKWLNNPREIHPLTRMMPVRLDEADLVRLLDLLDEDLSFSEKTTESSLSKNLSEAKKITNPRSGKTDTDP